MAPTARELLAAAAASGEDLESVARGLLARLAELTGLSSTYLAETRLNADEQFILFAHNTSDVFHIPEDISLPWSEGVCRFVSEGAPNYTRDAQTKEMVTSFKSGDTARAKALNDEMAPAFELLKIQTNPIPIKAAVNLLGHEVGGYRLPMVEPTDEELAQVRACLEKAGVLQPVQA